MLSKEEQKSLFEAKGEDVVIIEFRKCKAGDVFWAKNKLGDEFLFELTVPISRRVNVYRLRKGEDFLTSEPFCGNHHLVYRVMRFESTVYGEVNTSILVELKKVRSV